MTASDAKALLAMRASALLAVLDDSPDNVNGKPVIRMALLGHLATQKTDVQMGSKTVAHTLDVAGIWRHSNAGYTTLRHWLAPATRAALLALTEPDTPADAPPPPETPSLGQLRFPGAK